MSVAKPSRSTESPIISVRMATGEEMSKNSLSTKSPIIPILVVDENGNPISPVEDLELRITDLENKYVKTCWFETISSGTSGTITPPTGGVIALDEWFDGVDALVSEIQGGLPNYSTPRTSTGVAVTATLDAGGNWTLSGTPSAYPIALIFAYRVQLKNIDYLKTLTEIELDDSPSFSNIKCTPPNATTPALHSQRPTGDDNIGLRLQTNWGTYDIKAGVFNIFAIQTGTNGFIGINGTVWAPAADNTHDLGAGTLRWREIFAANGTINTSDSRLKTNVQEIPLGMDFVRQLRPRSFNWNDGTDERTHYGLIAQEVEELIQDPNTALVDKALPIEGAPEEIVPVKTQCPDGIYSIRYHELIPILIKSIQELETRIAVLEG